MKKFNQQKIEIFHPSTVNLAKRKAKLMAESIGLNNTAKEEVGLVVTELASNLVKHARGGTLILTMLNQGRRLGIKIESIDSGPGIPDVERAITDGFSTDGSLGYGLATVLRLMDEFDILSHEDPESRTYIVCKKWVHMNSLSNKICPLGFGAATRTHPGSTLNGDTFVIRKWEESALVSVIDGVGHGAFAHRAAQTARKYIEHHLDQPLCNIFREVGRVCRSTRGVVMVLVRFDWAEKKMSYANIGNIETRIIGSLEPIKFIVRRGIIGAKAPKPIVTEHHWKPDYIMILHTDGMKSHWQWDDFSYLKDKSATVIAQELLHKQAKDNDDATIVVVKGQYNEQEKFKTKTCRS